MLLYHNVDKKKQAEDSFRKNQAQLTEKRRLAEELTRDVPAAQEEAERRAKYMADQRDRLIALKKKEREEKVREEEERKAKGMSGADSPQKPRAIESQPKVDDDDDSQEQQRAILRLALARRMKQSLVESEEAKASAQEDQFSVLDKKLQEVERQRQDNKQRELLLQETLRKQQAQMARNVQKSAASLRHEDS